MFCKNCGSSLEENDLFCKNCGTPVEKEEVKEVEQPVQEPVEQVVQQPVQQPVEQVVEQPVQQPVQQSVQQNVQQPVQQTVQQSKTNAQKKASSVNKSGLIVVLVIVGLIIILGIVGIIGFVGFVSEIVESDIQTSVNNSGTSSNSSSSSSSTTGVTNTSSSNKSTYKVNFGGFDFRISDDLIYEKDSDFLYVLDEDETWMLQIEVVELSFSQVQSNKTKLKSLYEEMGYTDVGATQEKTVDGVDFLYNELTYSGTNFLAVMAKANSMYTFCITVVDANNEYNEDLLEEAAEIINTAKYTGEESNKMESDTSVDFSRITEIAQ